MKIPTGNFGYSVAEPQQAVRVDPNAYGAQTGAALEQAGHAVGGIADEQVQKQEQVQRELQQARTLRVLSQTKNGLRDIQDEVSRGVMAGDISTADAEKTWNERSSQYVAQQMTEADPEHRELLQAHIDDVAGGLRAGVRDAVTQRTQQEFGGELVGLRENLQREAQTDRAGANDRWAQTVATLGPRAGMSPAQIAADAQRFRESTAETAAYSLVNGAKDSMTGLAEADRQINGDGFADLDPQRKAVLNNTIAGARATLEQRAVMAAQRAEIAAERHERQAAQAFDAVRTLAQDGKAIDPTYADQVAKAVQGTPYAAALPSVLNSVKDGTAFAMQPLARQQAVLDQLAARGNSQGWTPESQKQFTKLQAAKAAADRDYADDALRAGLERGVLTEIAPISTASIPDIVQGIGTRMQQAQAVSVVTGKPESPFTKDEAAQVGQVIGALPLAQRASALSQLAAALGPQSSSAVARQIDKNDRALGLALQYANDMTTAGRHTSELVLSGAQAVKDGVVKVDAAKETGWRAQIATSVRGAFASPQQENAAIDAAFLIQAGLAADGQPSIDRALGLAGANIIERKGQKVPLPYGWDESRLQQTLRAFPEPQIAAQAPDGKVYLGKTAMPIADFVRQLPQAGLRHAGGGRYAITAGSGLATNAQGQPIIIDVTNPGRVPGAPQAAQPEASNAP